MDYKEEHLNSILHTEHYEELLTFYTDYFNSQYACIDFLYSILCYEPQHSFEFFNGELCYLDSEKRVINDEVFIPKRMLNAVQRFVSVARDIDIIRPGDDPFKIIYLITCIEALQSMRCRTINNVELRTKRQMRNDFFQSFTSPDDIDYIINHFERCRDNDTDLWVRNESSLQIFIDALGDIRNAAVHDGDCWEVLFPANNQCLIISIPDGITNTRRSFYENAITYEMLEKIFVRTCIRFIQQYICDMHP